MSHVIVGDNKEGLSLDETNATFMVLTTAGSETTATVLGGTLNYLVRHPDKMANLIGEIRERFHSYEEVTLEALRTLPYLNAVISEGLRLCPPLPWMLPRKVPAKGDTVCGVWLPGGVSSRMTISPAMISDISTRLLFRSKFMPCTVIPLTFILLHRFFLSVGWLMKSQIPILHSLMTKDMRSNRSVLVLGLV